MEKESHILLKNVDFGFERENVLSNISLVVNQGECVSILGASGSGKSTLLRLIANILPSEEVGSLSGEIKIFNKNPEDYLKTGEISFMFQEPSLMPNLDVRRNIEFPLKLRRKKIDNTFIDELINIVGLTDSVHKLPGELSGGMKTRVSLARAFATQPNLLLLDEPFSALDISWKYKLYNYLKEFQNRFKTTLILVTHDIQEAVLLSNKINVLSKSGKWLSNRNLKITGLNYFNYNTVLEHLKKNQEIIYALQTDILVDDIRKQEDQTPTEVIEFINNKIKKNEAASEDVKIALQKIRSHVNDVKVSECLLQMWDKSNNWDFKYEIIWRLLDIHSLPMERHQEVYEFLDSNWEKFVRVVKNDNYFQLSDALYKIDERINSNDYPKTKNWLYLNYLLALVQNSKYEIDAKTYINDYKKQNINKDPYLKYIIK